MKTKRLIIGLAAMFAVGVSAGAASALSLKEASPMQAKAVFADGEPVDIPKTPDYVYVCIDNSPWAQWHDFDGQIKLYTWGQNGDNPWPGVEPVSTETIAGRKYGKFSTRCSNNGKGESFLLTYEGYNDIADHKTVDIPYVQGKEVLYVKGSWGSSMNYQWGDYPYSELNDDLSIRLYDSRDYFATQGPDKIAKIYGWSNDTCKPGLFTWPGNAMTKDGAKAHGGQMYSYTYKKGDRVTSGLFDGGASDATKTEDLELQAGKTYVYNKNNDGGDWVANGAWLDNDSVDAAIDFVYTSMKMDSYDAAKEGTKTMGCLTYYGAAKTAYDNLDEDAKTAVEIIDSSAWARLSAWAEANGESFNTSTGFSLMNGFLPSSDNGNLVAVAVVSGLALAGIAGLAGLTISKRKKRQ